MDIGIRLRDYGRTLSEASWDDNAKISLVDSPLPVCKLDSLSKTVCRKLRGGVTLAGCDAFLESGGIYWFIEFKNQYARNIDKAEIQKKAYDSISCSRNLRRNPLRGGVWTELKAFSTATYTPSQSRSSVETGCPICGEWKRTERPRPIHR